VPKCRVGLPGQRFKQKKKKGQRAQHNIEDNDDAIASSFVG
jgi:hypothetical protein